MFHFLVLGINLVVVDSYIIYFQATLASAFAKKDYDKAAAIASRVLQVFN